jgi:hypothetical protein
MTIVVPKEKSHLDLIPTGFKLKDYITWKGVRICKSIFFIFLIFQELLKCQEFFSLRWIRNFFIRDSSVFGLIPSTLAAPFSPLIRHPVSSRALIIC